MILPHFTVPKCTSSVTKTAYNASIPMTPMAPAIPEPMTAVGRAAIPEELLEDGELPPVAELAALEIADEMALVALLAKELMALEAEAAALEAAP